jgi:hypothetical protein
VDSACLRPKGARSMRRQYADGHRVAHPACGPLFSGSDQLDRQ